MLFDEFLSYASLSMGSYENLRVDINDNDNALLNKNDLLEGDFTETLYNSTFSNWSVASTSSDFTGSSSGFTGHAFVNDTNEITIGFRGTDDFSDVAEDSVMWLEGAAFTQIATMVNWWNTISADANEVIDQFEVVSQVQGQPAPNSSEYLYTSNIELKDYYVVKSQVTTTEKGDLVDALATSNGKVNVTGHSLGGHLAMAFTGIFGDVVDEAVTFNAPGFDDNAAVNDFFQFLGGSVPQPGDAKITNIIADADTSEGQSASPIAGLHSIPGNLLNVPIEDQTDLDDPDNPIALNHSQLIMTDSLAVMAAVEPFIQSFDNTVFESMLGLAADNEYKSLESIAYSLEKLINGGASEIIPGNDNREALYQSLKNINDSPLNGELTLSLLPPEDLIASASQDTAEGLAYRYALENLNPFALVHTPAAGEASIYDQHNLNGELNAENFSAQYLADRLALLNYKNTAHQNNDPDLNITTSDVPDNINYHDKTLGFYATLAAPGDVNDFVEVVFGGDGDDELTNLGNGSNEMDDRIYGRDGNDTIHANGGDDWLEGGRGVDMLYGGAGIDTYHFNAGDALIAGEIVDTIFDTDADNVLSFGAGIDGQSFEYIDFGTDDLAIKYTANGVEQFVLLDDWQNNQDMIAELQFTDTPSITFNPAIDELKTFGVGSGQWSGTNGDDEITYNPTLFDTADYYKIAGFAGDDELSGFDVSGGSGDDTITFFDPNGVTGINGGKLYGGSGSDTITGSQYGDFISTYTDGAIANLFTLLKLESETDDLDLSNYNLEGIPGVDFASHADAHLPADSATAVWYEQLASLALGAGDVNEVFSGDGNDEIYGGFGDEIYHFNTGEAVDNITDMGGNNTLTFDYDLASTDIVVHNGNFLFHQGNGFRADLAAGIFQENATGYLNGFKLNGNAFLPQGDALQTFGFQFTDGTVDIAAIKAKAFSVTGSAGDDTVLMNDDNGFYAGNDSKTIDTGAGNDSIYFTGNNATIDAGTGNDTIHFQTNDGMSSTIKLSLGDGEDTLINAGFYTPDINLEIDGVDAEDLLIETSEPQPGQKEWTIRYSDNDSLTVRGVGGLNSFNFILPAGLMLSMSDIQESVALSDAGGDAYTGSSVGSTITAGAGIDIIYDYVGNDTTYEFTLGNGHDLISEYNATQDAINFYGDVAEEDLTFSADNNDLVIAYSDFDSITIKDWYMGTNNEVETINFASGGSIDYAQLMSIANSFAPPATAITGTGFDDFLDGTITADEIIGLAGNDYIYAYDGNDTLTGGAGDDYLDGGWGNDAYIFNAGDGFDIIYESQGDDRIEFGAGIFDVDVSFTRFHGDLSIHYSTTDTIILGGWYFSPDQQIENILFDDGTIWDQAYLAAATSNLVDEAVQPQTITGTEFDDSLYGAFGDDQITGLAGNDYIETPDGNNIINAGLGDDYVSGGYGNDTYILNQGDGHDFYFDPNGADTLTFGTGISDTDITFDRMGLDLFVGFGTNDSVTIQDWYANTANQIETFAFDGGITWDQATLQSMTDSLPDSLAINGTGGDDILTGSMGNDIINGFAGNDTLDGVDGYNTLIGGTGNDTLIGGSLDDTYVFKAGDGQDTINDAGGWDTLVFDDSTLSLADLLIDVNGDDLLFENTSTGDSITVNDGYANQATNIESVFFQNGEALYQQDIQMLADQAALSNAA